MLLCQAVVGAFSESGDSGSPVFRITNSPSTNDVTLYGILWGGQVVGGERQFMYSPYYRNLEVNDFRAIIKACHTNFNC